MAVYVTSDAHGHVRALDEALSAASPGADDVIYVLGDMIDRGPDPLGVIKLVRSLPNARVLMGNHEQIMLTATARSGAPHDGAFDISHFGMDEFLDWTCWMQNGGAATSGQMEKLSSDEYEELRGWISELPRYAVVEVAGRLHALVHAGIDPARAAGWLRGGGLAVVDDGEVVGDAPEVSSSDDGASTQGDGEEKAPAAGEATPTVSEDCADKPDGDHDGSASVSKAKSEAAGEPEPSDSEHSDGPDEEEAPSPKPGVSASSPAREVLSPSALDPSLLTADQLGCLLAAQDPEDLLWVRELFWSVPTGLIGADGCGPLVISGHTPSPYLPVYIGRTDIDCATSDGHGKVVELGACDATGGVADKVDIDCAAAGGFGIGRVGILRLDDRATWYAEVCEGE